MIVQLCVTCLVDSLFPEVGECAVELLERAGFHVNYLENQTCCGQPPLNAGFRAEARKIAMHTLNTFEKSEGPIVIPSGSCVAMIKHHYTQLFADDPFHQNRAQKFTERIFELSEFIHNITLRELPNLPRYKAVAYHPSCHLLRDLKIHRQPIEILQRAGYRVIELDADCCGFGGVFSVDHVEISNEMLKRKLQAIELSNAECVVACDVSCLMQIEGGLRKARSNVRCSHLAQILAGREPGLR